ncbi:hypothetical protein [Sphingomonas sp. PAMC 26605]|uniref:hypothetical protein n=1 Tax=Sphingomonas sp. PAMC 26605 TaxID=1112214 RepID=UPI00026CD15A|nr:hypothetical protein [Sphingomonas sp. PAMC 26605]
MNPPVPRAARRWILLCLAGLGGLIVFCAGILLGRHQADTRPPPHQSPSATRGSPTPRFRDVFSPSVTSDQHVLEEQRKLVEALERACERQRQKCDLARNARAYLNAHS